MMLRSFVSAFIAFSLILFTPTVNAQQRQKELVFFSMPNSLETARRDEIVQRTVQGRVREWNVSVRKVKHSNSAGITHEHQAQCESENPIGCFWITESDEGSVVHLIYFSEQSSWTIERKLNTNEYAPVAESAAMVIRSTLEAAMTQTDEVTPNQLGPQREQTRAMWAVTDSEPIPAALPKKTVQRETLPPYPVEVGVGYEVAMIARDIDMSHGIGISVAFSPSARLSVFAHYSGTFSTTFNDDQVSLQMIPHPTQLGLRWNRYRGGLGLSLVAAAGLNPISTTTTQHINVFSTTQQTFWQWSVLTGARLSMRLRRWLHIYVGAAGDILITRPTYKVEYANGERTLFRPWPISPRVQIGVLFQRIKFK